MELITLSQGKQVCFMLTGPIMKPTTKKNRLQKSVVLIVFRHTFLCMH